MSGLTVEFTNAATQRRRYRFIPRGDSLGWWRIEEEFSAGEWQPVSKEVVTGVAIEADSEIADVVGDDHGGAGTVIGS